MTVEYSLFRLAPTLTGNPLCQLHVARSAGRATRARQRSRRVCSVLDDDHGPHHHQGWCMEGAQTRHLVQHNANYSLQNTEDEVLKAAIAKYGKNQWYACALLTSILSTNLGS